MLLELRELLDTLVLLGLRVLLEQSKCFVRWEECPKVRRPRPGLHAADVGHGEGREDVEEVREVLHRLRLVRARAGLLHLAAEPRMPEPSQAP